MNWQYTAQDPTLYEIAKVLGMSHDTVLQWIIEGRLTLARQDAQTIMIVDPHQGLNHPNTRRFLILTKKAAKQKRRPCAC
jgi:hypothetical protein